MGGGSSKGNVARTKSDPGPAAVVSTLDGAECAAGGALTQPQTGGHSPVVPQNTELNSAGVELGAELNRDTEEGSLPFPVPAAAAAGRAGETLNSLGLAGPAPRTTHEECDYEVPVMDWQPFHDQGQTSAVAAEHVSGTPTTLAPVMTPQQAPLPDGVAADIALELSFPRKRAHVPGEHAGGENGLDSDAAQTSAASMTEGQDQSDRHASEMLAPMDWQCQAVHPEQCQTTQSPPLSLKSEASRTSSRFQEVAAEGSQTRSEATVQRESSVLSGMSELARESSQLIDALPQPYSKDLASLILQQQGLVSDALIRQLSMQNQEPQGSVANRSAAPTGQDGEKTNRSGTSALVSEIVAEVQDSLYEESAPGPGQAYADLTPRSGISGVMTNASGTSALVNEMVADVQDQLYQEGLRGPHPVSVGLTPRSGTSEVVKTVISDIQNSLYQGWVGAEDGKQECLAEYEQTSVPLPRAEMPVTSSSERPELMHKLMNEDENSGDVQGSASTQVVMTRQRSSTLECPAASPGSSQGTTPLDLPSESGDGLLRQDGATEEAWRMANEAVFAAKETIARLEFSSQMAMAMETSASTVIDDHTAKDVLATSEQSDEDGCEEPISSSFAKVSGITMKLTLDFSIAGDGGSARRASFEKELRQDLANATGVLRPYNFQIMSVAPGSITVNVNIRSTKECADPHDAASELQEQATNPNSPLRAGVITRFIESLKMIPIPMVSHVEHMLGTISPEKFTASALVFRQDEENLFKPTESKTMHQERNVDGALFHPTPNHYEASAEEAADPANLPEHALNLTSQELEDTSVTTVDLQKKTVVPAQDMPKEHSDIGFPQTTYQGETAKTDEKEISCLSRAWQEQKENGILNAACAGHDPRMGSVSQQEGVAEVPKRKIRTEHLRPLPASSRKMKTSTATAQTHCHQKVRPETEETETELVVLRESQAQLLRRVQMLEAALHASSTSAHQLLDASNGPEISAQHSNQDLNENLTAIQLQTIQAQIGQKSGIERQKRKTEERNGFPLLSEEYYSRISQAESQSSQHMISKVTYENLCLQNLSTDRDTSCIHVQEQQRWSPTSASAPSPRSFASLPSHAHFSAPSIRRDRISPTDLTADVSAIADDMSVVDKQEQNNFQAPNRPSTLTLSNDGLPLNAQDVCATSFAVLSADAQPTPTLQQQPAEPMSVNENSDTEPPLHKNWWEVRDQKVLAETGRRLLPWERERSALRDSLVKGEIVHREARTKVLSDHEEDTERQRQLVALQHRAADAAARAEAETVRIAAAAAAAPLWDPTAALTVQKPLPALSTEGHSMEQEGKSNSQGGKQNNLPQRTRARILDHGERRHQSKQSLQNQLVDELMGKGVSVRMITAALMRTGNDPLLLCIAYRASAPDRWVQRSSGSYI